MSTTTPSIRTQVAATVKRCTVIVGVIFGLAIGCQAGSGTDHAEDTQTPAVPTVQHVEPQEGDPAFDCRIHGNGICGSDVTGTYAVPGGVLTVYADTTARYVPNAELVGCDRTAGPCTAGELTGVDRDGELMIARDLNGDGVIAGDVEYGS